MQGDETNKILKDVSEEEWVVDFCTRYQCVYSHGKQDTVCTEMSKQTQRTEKEGAKKAALYEFMMYTENNFHILEEIN